MSTLNVSLSTDADGFLSQECPACRRCFKVIFGEGSKQPIGFCPYCQHAGHGCWWTPQQAKYLRDVVAQQVVTPSLKDMARRINGRSSGPVRMTMRVSQPSTPVPPSEANDPMTMTKFACCGERIKHDPAEAEVFCVICGNRGSTDASAA